MKNEKVEFIKRSFLTFMINFVIIYTLSIVIFATIYKSVYDDKNFIHELLIISIGSLISSFILTNLLRIDRISILFQAVLVFITISLNVLFTGYFLVVYDFHYNIKLPIVTLIALVLGLIGQVVVFDYTNKKTNIALNDKLQHFKEKDNYEETL